MLIERKHTADLIPADYNPRVALTPDMPEFERLKNSIETFGNVEPIVWNERTGHIVGGQLFRSRIFGEGFLEIEAYVEVFEPVEWVYFRASDAVGPQKFHRK